VKRPAAIALALAAWLVGVPLAHGVLPWLISLVGPRYLGGWNALGPHRLSSARRCRLVA
jgi:hypothetical protein